MIAGIDEAGRGALIGPLAIAIYLIRDERELPRSLRDSKQLSPEQREALFEELASIGTYEVVLIPPSKIDERNLNTIEIETMRSLLEKHKPKKAIIDSFLKDPSPLKVEGIEVVAEHKADERYPVVAAASIIAKVSRDREIRKLHKKFGYFGSGYPSDPITVEFARKHLKELEEAGVIRKKWKTYQELKKPKQGKMSSFFE